MSETPKHYDKDIQPWDALRAWLSPEEFRGFLRGNVVKYLARCRDKGGVDDLKKAAHYLEKLIEEEGGGTVADPPPIETVRQAHVWGYRLHEGEHTCVRCQARYGSEAAKGPCVPSSREPAEGVPDAATANPS